MREGDDGDHGADGYHGSRSDYRNDGLDDGTAHHDGTYGTNR